MRRTVLAPLVTALVLAVAPAATGADRPPRYVAMGDSYSAASGVLPPDPTAPPQCLRSTRNYPHVIASRVDVRLRDVTCGAAETDHYSEEQYPGVPPQLDALTRRTRLVTMTIGGNDEGVFIGAIAKCGTAGLTTLGQGSPCRDEYGRSFVRTIRQQTAPALVRGAAGRPPPCAAGRGRDPRLPVDRPGGDGLLRPVADRRGRRPVPAQHPAGAQRRRGAGGPHHGSTYVDLGRASDGHDACQDPGVRWVEPVLQGTNPVVVHPNALGERRMARQRDPGPRPARHVRRGPGPAVVRGRAGKPRRPAGVAPAWSCGPNDW